MYWDRLKELSKVLKDAEDKISNAREIFQEVDRYYIHDKDAVDKIQLIRFAVTYDSVFSRLISVKREVELMKQDIDRIYQINHEEEVEELKKKVESK
jgi:hypothetical protein